MLSLKRKAANGCSVNHWCQQTDPIMSANPGNTGGKFKSSSMKHLINILNVSLAIYAGRAMGRFGVPLIFHWKRGACAQGQGARFGWLEAARGEVHTYFQTRLLAWGYSLPVLTLPLPVGRPSLWAPPWCSLGHLWWTAWELLCGDGSELGS